MSSEITQNDLAGVAESVREATSRAHNLLALEVFGNIREEAPQDHGRLAGSFTMQGGELETTIGTAVVYAAMQEHGGTVTAKDGGLMRFQIKGQWVSLREFTVPATHYIERSIDDAQSRVSDFVTIALQEQGLA